MFDRLTLFLAWIAAILFAVAGVMLTYEVAARYCFGFEACSGLLNLKPTIWAMELSQLCLIWGSLLAMAWLLSARRHIAVDAVIRLLSERAQNVVEALAMLVVAVFSAAVAWKGWAIFWDSFERGRTTGSMLDLPSWVTELSIPVGFALLCAQALIEARRAYSGELERATVALE